MQIKRHSVIAPQGLALHILPRALAAVANRTQRTVAFAPALCRVAFDMVHDDLRLTLI